MFWMTTWGLKEGGGRREEGGGRREEGGGRREGGRRVVHKECNTFKSN